MADRTRGEFLSLTSVGLGAMIGGVIGVPATAYMLAPVTKEVTFTPVFLGKMSAFPSEHRQFKPTPATYIEDPSNPATSPGLAFVHNTGRSSTDWHSQDAMFVVFSNRCMHLGCPIAANSSGFACPATAASTTRMASEPRARRSAPSTASSGRSRTATSSGSPSAGARYLRRRGALLPGQDARPAHAHAGPSWIPDVLYPHVTYTHGPVPGPVPLPKA